MVLPRKKKDEGYPDIIPLFFSLRRCLEK